MAFVDGKLRTGGCYVPGIPQGQKREGYAESPCDARISPHWQPGQRCWFGSRQLIRPMVFALSSQQSQADGIRKSHDLPLVINRLKTDLPKYDSSYLL